MSAEITQTNCTDCLKYQNTLRCIARSVRELWQAIADGRYSSRSLIGDEVLNIKEALQEAGIELPSKSRR